MVCDTTGVSESVDNIPRQPDAGERLLVSQKSVEFRVLLLRMLFSSCNFCLHSTLLVLLGFSMSLRMNCGDEFFNLRSCSF